MSKYIVHKAIDKDALSAKTQRLIDGEPRLISPKYDGCHVVFLFNEGKLEGARSRDDKPVRSMQHVAEALPVYYPWLQQGQRAVCGEAWIPGRDFEEISGAFRRHSNQESLRFVPFDTVCWTLYEGRPLLSSEIPYGFRLRNLSGAWRGWDAYGPVIAPTYELVAGDEASIMAKADNMARVYKQRGGYDGAIVALESGTYTAGAGTGGEFVKVKPLLSESYVVTGCKHDIGEKTGKHTLSLQVEHDGKVQYVSTGLKQADIDAYSADPFLILGKVIEIEYMGITNGGMLREPRYKGIRDDA